MSTDPDKAKKEPSEDESATEDSKSETAKPAKTTKSKKTAASKSSSSKSSSSKASASKSSASASSSSSASAAGGGNGKGENSGDEGGSSGIDWNLRGQMLLRGLLMILAAIAVEISIFLLYVMTGAHFIYQLIMAKPLDRVTELCGRLSAFSHKLLDFIGYHSDKPVFPFAPFPEASPQDEDSEKDGGKTKK